MYNPLMNVDMLRKIRDIVSVGTPTIQQIHQSFPDITYNVFKKKIFRQLTNLKMVKGIAPTEKGKFQFKVTDFFTDEKIERLVTQSPYKDIQKEEFRQAFVREGIEAVDKMAYFNENVKVAEHPALPLNADLYSRTKKESAASTEKESSNSIEDENENEDEDVDVNVEKDIASMKKRNFFLKKNHESGNEQPEARFDKKNFEKSSRVARTYELDPEISRDTEISTPGYQSDDRMRVFEGSRGGYRRPFNQERSADGSSGYQKPFNRDRPYSDSNNSYRKPFSRDRISSESNNSYQKPYSRDRTSSDLNSDYQKPFNRDKSHADSNNSYQKPFSRDRTTSNSSYQRPFSREGSSGGYRKPFDRQAPSDRPWTPRDKDSFSGTARSEGNSYSRNRSPAVLQESYLRGRAPAKLYKSLDRIPPKKLYKK